MKKDMDMPELKIYEIDNATGEGNIWKMKFPELENDVVSPAVVDDNLGDATMCDNDFTYVTSITTLKNWSMSIVTDVEKKHCNTSRH